MILETPLDEAWATLSTLAPARGTLAGHTGTATLEEADDDTHTARLRLQGTGPNGPVTATVTATLEPWTPAPACTSPPGRTRRRTRTTSS